MQRAGAEPPPVSSVSAARVGAILGVAVICAGVAYPVTAAALRHTSASVITTSRALGGGLVMLPALRLVGARLPRGLRAWAWVLAISIGNVVLTLAGIAEGTRLAGAAVASVLLNSAPFFAALFARIWLDEHLTGRQTAGLVVGFAGILLIAGSPAGASGSDVRLGVVICLSGALGWAAAGLGMRYLSTHEAGFDVYGASTAQFLCGGVLLIPYLVTTRPTPTDWSSGDLWASLAFLVLGAQVVTYIGFYVALSHWTSARVFSWTFLVPAVAVGIEALQGSLPGAAASLGLVIVIVGVGLVTSRADRRRA
ncbi:MAG TPA: EamA family transporter [Gaiellales bacterium]|jgi:O-acetylserine/cysteine efflux transporter|nr:EamA family transporter [Gaiellales bacterium]